jgi:predicted HTH transcriptional regulator
MSKLRIFVSSAQQELENERQTVLSLVSTDSFLQQHCEAVLYEMEPAAPKKAIKECVTLVGACDIYLLIVWKEAGHPVGSIAITRKEYRRAKAKGLPILVYIKGAAEVKRKKATEEFLAEIKNDGFKYKRFSNVIDLQEEVRKSLLKLLKEKYGIEPSSDENEIAEQTIKATSEFENQALRRLRWEDLDFGLAKELFLKADRNGPKAPRKQEVLSMLSVRGLVWNDSEGGVDYATAAGVIILGKDPSAVFPHCRFLCDAYAGVETDDKPLDHQDIRGPLPAAIEHVIAFIDKNTRHPIRIVGLNRVRLDEYPVEALREALVNAGAHRDYDDKSRKIMVETFSDQVVISSPGMPPPPITLQKLRSGKYKPCSRNPVIAQCLSYFHRLEERGSGIRRMKNQMIDYGLDEPRLATESGYFQVVFPGPGNNLRRLRLPIAATGATVSPSVEQQLNGRQKKIVAHVLKEGLVTSGWCKDTLKVTYDTANRDLLGLVSLKVLTRQGKGRSTRFVLVGSK